MLAFFCVFILKSYKFIHYGLVVNIYLAAVGIQDSGNLGALARLCHNFSLAGLITISKACKVDERAYRRSTHGSNYLDDLIEYSSIQEFAADMDYTIGLSARLAGSRSFERKVEPLPLIFDDLRKMPYRTLAIVLGPESTGLSNNDLKWLNRVGTISLGSSNPVFNISHAAAIALYELFRDPFVPASVEIAPMHGKTREILLNEIQKTINLLEDDYWWRTHMMQILRNVFGRSLVTQSEADGTIGLFKKINGFLHEHSKKKENE